MNRKQKKNCINNDPILSHDLIRRYLESDVSASEAQTVQRQMLDSEDFRQEYAKVENYLFHLRTLPKKNPPEKIWAKIQTQIEKEKPTRVWFPWLYAHPNWRLAAKALPVLLLIVTVLGVGNNYWATPKYYDVVVIDDANGFGQEAESYVIYHDLAGEPLPLRDSLIAYCIDSGS